MPAFADVFAQRLEALEAQQLRRSLVETTRTENVILQRGGKSYLSFSCNNYLGLAQDTRVIAAAQNALADYGVGSGASRLVTGQHPLHRTLEARLAEHQGSDAALLFGSGYLANLGVITALMGPEDLILLDRLSHACLLDGARMSEATWLRFKHNDPADALRLLKKHRARHRHCLIITETVFSMDGDRAPLARLRALADAHDAWLMADDAHGLYARLSARSGEKPDIVSGTLSKSLASYGGYVCAKPSVTDYLATSARSFMFTTALPATVLAATLAALDIAEAEPDRAARALTHAQRFCTALGLPTAHSQIVPLLFGDAALALAAMQQLEQEGLLVTAIRPPTVPKGTSRLRVSFSAAHTEAHVDRLIAAIRPLIIHDMRRHYA